MAKFTPCWIDKEFCETCAEHRVTHTEDGACTVLTRLNPAAFVDLGKGSRDPEWLAMEADITEDLVKLEVVERIPAYVHFSGAIREIFNHTKDKAVDAHNNIIALKDKTGHQAVIDRCMERGYNIAYGDIMNRLGTILENLDKSLTRLNDRKKV